MTEEEKKYMNEREIRDHVRGRVRKVASKFEDEIRRRAEREEQWALQLKAVPKGGRFRGKVPTTISAKLAALMKNFEGNNNLNSSFQYKKKGDGKGWKAKTNVGKLGADSAELASTSIPIKRGKAKVASGTTAEGASKATTGMAKKGNAAVSSRSGVTAGVAGRVGGANSARAGNVDALGESQKGSLGIAKSHGLGGNSAGGKSAQGQLQKGQFVSGAQGVKVGQGALMEDGADVEELDADDVDGVDVEDVDVEAVEFTALDAKEAALELKPEQALYTATVIYDFDAEEPTELAVPHDAQVEVYEVTDDGWALVKHDGKVGWVPLSYLRENPKVGSAEPKTNEYGEDILFNALRPNMEIRETVVNLIAKSALFSEVRAIKEIEVYVDDIDAILREGRTVAATLAVLLWLDDQRRKFETFEQLAGGVKETRTAWDPVIDTATKDMFATRMRLFANPNDRNLYFDRILTEKVMMESTAGVEGAKYLKKLADSNVKAAGLDDLINAVSKCHSDARAAKDKYEQDVKKAILAELQSPNIKLFADGFIDLDMRSLEQMIVRGFTADDIIAGLRTLNDQEKTFQTFGALMGAIYEDKMGEKPPSLITREYITKGRQAGALKSINEADALKPQQKVDLMMKMIAKPGCKLFTESKGNLRVRIEDLQKLLSSNEHVTTILADFIFLNALEKKFSDFKQIQEAQSGDDLKALKKKVYDYLHSWPQLQDHDFKMEDVEFAFVLSEYYGHPMSILTSPLLLKKAPFATTKSLGLAMNSVVPEILAARKADQDKILDYLGKNAMFSVSVQVYAHYIDALIDAAGYSGANVIKVFDEFKAASKRFASFEDLIQAVKDAYKKSGSK